MSRRRAADKREIQPDPKYGDVVVSKFMNSLMYAGRKSAAESILYGAFDLIEGRSGQNPVKVFHEAIDNVKPMIEVRSRRVGGATYQVPIEVRTGRARRWRSAGSSASAASAASTPWSNASPASSWTPRTAAAPRSRSVKTPTAWRKPTRRFRTTAGSARTRPRFTE